MAESLGSAAVVAALSEYEAHPVAVMEALMLGIPTVGLDTAGIGDLVEDGLVVGVPRDASPTAIARILVAALEGVYASSSIKLPTWDTAASDLARVYMDAVGTASPLGL
jgi:glycosyltransferase involved in cell wall biosynthesis